MDRVTALSRVEAELGGLRGRRGRAVVEAWAARCRLLANDAVRVPADIPGWLRQLAPAEADSVFRLLVESAQAEDRASLLTVLACLRPGLCALASRIGVPLDEVVSEAVFVVYEFPFSRRRTVAGQVLLDTRLRFKRARETARREISAGDTRLKFDPVAPGDLGVKVHATEELAGLVHDAWLVGALSEDDARIIVETRVCGLSVVEAADRRGITRHALNLRRLRAEARLGEALR